MKLLLILALSLLGHITPGSEKDKVLICKGPNSYAYHSGYCQGLKKCSAEVVKMTIEDATKLKRTACGYCYKNGGTAAASLYSNSSGGRSSDSSTSSQCHGITKKGMRCSRMVRGGGNCWQHGG